MSDIERAPTIDDLIELSDVVPAVRAIIKARNFAKKVAKIRLDRWWKGLVKESEGKTPQEIQGLIEAKIESSREAKETVWAAAKEILDAVSDEACEVIGSLTDEYLQNNAGPDAFFRGAIRVLADLSTSELSILRDLVKVGTQVKGETVTLTYLPQGEIKATTTFDHVSRLSVLTISKEAIMRIMRLLKANDLGTDSSTPIIGDTGGGSIQCDHVVLTRLFEHLK